jgi:hypothetical protein
MSIFRRLKAASGEAEAESETPGNDQRGQAESPRAEAQPPAPGQYSRPAAPPPVPHHLERALLAMTSKMQTVLERLDELDRRVNELNEAIASVPSHSDVLEVRLHSAKLAAELARSTVELRGEIGLASEEARRAARLARSDDEATDPSFSLPVDLDLTSENNTSSDRQSQSGNWTRTA